MGSLRAGRGAMPADTCEADKSVTEQRLGTLGMLTQQVLLSTMLKVSTVAVQCKGWAGQLGRGAARPLVEHALTCRLSALASCHLRIAPSLMQLLVPSKPQQQV